MKWVTRERARVDCGREAADLNSYGGSVYAAQGAHRCAQRFAEMPPVERVAIPYDVPGVELGHHGDRCSFDAFLDKYELNEPALQELALIVRGADTAARQLTPESAGLYALATGFQAIARDDHDNMARQFPAYDALYAYCRAKIGAR